MTPPLLPCEVARPFSLSRYSPWSKHANSCGEGFGDDQTFNLHPPCSETVSDILMMLYGENSLLEKTEERSKAGSHNKFVGFFPLLLQNHTLCKQIGTI